MSGFNDHATIDGDWKHGSPSPREAFKSILGDGISSRSDINRRSESEKKTVFERVAVREGLNVPALHTGNIVVSHDFSSNNMYTRSPYFTIPTGLCPTTLLESPIFLSSSLDQRSPTTGKFQFAPDGNGTISNLDEENVDSTFFSYKPVIESGHSSFLVASSKITPVPISSNILRSQVEKDLPISETSHFHWGDDVNSQARVVDVVGGSVADSPPSDDGEDLTGVGDATRSADASEDGYNWRKYGQKQVKGSDYPRSYYKCTHASCTVKKKIERSREGHITEIIYKGAHNHPTPHPDRISTHGLIDSRNIQNGVAFESSSAFCNYDDDEEESDSNRRKMGEYVSETSEGTRAIKKPKVVVQTTSQVDILDDGYHWRKYGQKVVKGNPNPRSYYKCTSPGCIVRKQVERASHDLNSVITMYEGKHNHDVPAARNSGYSNSGSPVNGTAQVGNNVSLLAHLQRADPSQIHNNTYGFYGMNESGLANLVMARLGTSSEMGFVLPKGEPNSEPLSESSHLNIPNFPNVNSEVMRNYG